MATDPVVDILRQGIEDAKAEKEGLRTQIFEVDSRISRMTAAIQVVGKNGATASAPKSKKRKPKTSRPHFISEATVDKVAKRIGAKGGLTVPELSKASGYSIASIADAAATLLERGIVTRSRDTKPGRGPAPYQYWLKSTES